VPNSFRVASPRLLLIALLSAVALGAGAQTAPQLLPYTAKLIAGGGSTAATVGATCQRGVSPAPITSSGNVSYDIYGDGCLATEITLSAGSSGPRYAIADSTGAIYFSDYANGLVRRIDPLTGIVTTIAGGAGSNPVGGASCGIKDTAHTVTTSDVFADGCLGTSVKLGKPTALVFSPTGDLYFSDTYNYNIRKMSFSNGGVAAVIINGGGSSYTTAPTVTFSAPPSGTTATGTATISNGVVTGVTITSSGSGYTTAPTVTFSVSGSGTTATGTAVYTGVMSMAAGSDNGTSTSAKGYTAGCTVALTASSSSSPTWCQLDAPYGLAFDAAGDLYISEEYYEAILVLNTNLTGSTTVATVNIPAQTIVKVVGSRASGAACLTGTGTTTTGNSGCNYGNYTNGTAATLSELDAPYAVALDSSNNIYIANEFNNQVAEVLSSTGILGNFAGLYPANSNSIIEPATLRGPAGFQIGTDYGLAIDSSNNTYVTDALAGYVWRIDAKTGTMYVVGGGGAATTAGTACGALTAIDIYGDGCPARLANFSKSGTLYASTGIFGVSTDNYGDVFLGDEGNGLIREIASGTQFGATGASATDYIDIHFAAGDTPATTTPFAITAGASIFTLGTPVCTTNADNNGSANTEDCVIPVTASPTVTGPYIGTLTVKSTAVPGGTNFPLSGNFVQSPVTRLALTSASTIVACSGTVYATTTPVTLTASLTANGPSAPTGTITFYTGPTGSLTQIGTPQTLTNIGTTSSPVYGANLTYTFATAGTYNVTAIYTPTTNSYFQGSSNTTGLTSQAPTFTLSPISYQTTQPIVPGQTALYSFLINQANYTGTIGFTVTGLPANSTYSITPTTVTGGGCVTTSTVALSIYTQQQITALPASFGGAGHGRWQLMSVVAGLGLALLIGLRRRRLPMYFGQIGMVLALLLMGASTVGCGKAVGTVLTPGTPASPAGQPYTIVVTPTTTVGTAPAPVTFSLTVL
jgi:hypothetical protein